MQTRRSSDLLQIENQIRLAVQQHTLEEILLGLKRAGNRLHPFQTAAVTLFAMRHCNAGPRARTGQALDWNELTPLVDLITEYVLTDPIVFDENIREDLYNSNPVFALLRMAGNQMPYSIGIFGQYARPKVLFHEMSKQISGDPRVPEFDFDACFRNVNGVDLIDFIAVGFVAYAAAQTHLGFTRAYFNKARAGTSSTQR